MRKINGYNEPISVPRFTAAFWLVAAVLMTMLFLFVVGVASAFAQQTEIINPTVNTRVVWDHDPSWDHPATKPQGFNVVLDGVRTDHGNVQRGPVANSTGQIVEQSVYSVPINLSPGAHVVVAEAYVRDAAGVETRAASAEYNIMVLLLGGPPRVRIVNAK